MILRSARDAYRHYRESQLTREQLATFRVIAEAELAHGLDHPPKTGMPADAQTPNFCVKLAKS